MKKLLFILLVLPFVGRAQPPPISTEPLSVNSSHVLFPTDMTEDIIRDSMTAINVVRNVRVVATTNVTLSGVQTIDGLSSSGSNAIVLLTAQNGATPDVNNGPWAVNDSGAWTRPTWYKNGSALQAIEDMIIFVRSGNTLNGSIWALNSAAPITIGTTPTSWLVRPIRASTLNGTLAAGQFPALTGPVTTIAGSLATTITAAAVTYANIQNVAGISVFGRSASTSGVGADITGTANQVLRVNSAGTLLGFGTISASAIPDAVADGATKGVASFTAADFNSTSGNISLDYVNGQAASGSVNGFLSSTDWTTFNSKVSGTRLINTTSPLAGGGDLSADRTLSIANAAADGTTKGAASFTAADFNSSSGNISIDYTNGQEASASVKGFLTAADWTTFNGKGNGTVTNFIAGDLSPLFTTAETATTTFPSLTFSLTAAAAHTVFGNFTGSSGAPSHNVLGTGVDTFLTTPSASNLRSAIASSAVTGTAGNLVFSGGPTFTGTSLFNGNVQIGAGTTSPTPLMAILGTPIAFTAKIGASNSYAQFAMKNELDAQRGFMGFIGSTFSNANRQNNFEFGTSSGSKIAFRPGDGDGNQFLMDENGNLMFGNTSPGTGAQRVLVFGGSNPPSTSPTNTGQLYQDSADGVLKYRGRSGTVTNIALP